MVFGTVFSSCCQAISLYYITPDPVISCGEGHEPCLTLDQFAATENIEINATMVLTPGRHTLTRNIEIIAFSYFSILAEKSVNIQCTSPASFLFEDISNLEIRNTAIVSCGGGNSSGALQVQSVQQLNIINVTLQENVGVSLLVQDSNGLLRNTMFFGNTGAGMNITNSTIVFEGSNTFSDNLDGGIALYRSTLQFCGVNQFINNTATSGGGISAISSTINCSRSRIMIFENNSAKKYGGGFYAFGSRISSEGHSRNAASSYCSGGLCASDSSAVANFSVPTIASSTIMQIKVVGLLHMVMLLYTSVELPHS